MQMSGRISANLEQMKGMTHNQEDILGEIRVRSSLRTLY